MKPESEKPDPKSDPEKPDPEKPDPEKPDPKSDPLSIGGGGACGAGDGHDEGALPMFGSAQRAGRCTHETDAHAAQACGTGWDAHGVMTSCEFLFTASNNTAMESS